MSDTTADVESDFIEIECPAFTSYVFEEGKSQLYVKARDSAGADITTGVLRVYKATKDKAQKWKIAEIPLEKVQYLTGYDKQLYYLMRGIALKEKQIVLMTLESATAAVADNSEFYLNGRQIIEVLEI
jgi:hypothetical protein